MTGDGDLALSPTSSPVARCRLLSGPSFRDSGPFTCALLPGKKSRHSPLWKGPRPHPDGTSAGTLQECGGEGGPGAAWHRWEKGAAGGSGAVR